jgi:hypothetical protein
MTKFTYDCQNSLCENMSGIDAGIDIPDDQFPTHDEVVLYDLNPELCIECQPIEGRDNVEKMGIDIAFAIAMKGNEL